MLILWYYCPLLIKTLKFEQYVLTKFYVPQIWGAVGVRSKFIIGLEEKNSVIIEAKYINIQKKYQNENSFLRDPGTYDKIWDLG